MIKIQHKNIDEFAIRHYNLIENFLLRANKKNKIYEQNKRIQSIFGEKSCLKKIILALPDEMEDLIEIWKNTESDKKEFSYYVTTLYPEFSSGKNLIYIDNEGQTNNYNALKLVDDLEIQVCPYCNRSFINNTNKEGKRTCDIDHFYPKKLYPFLAISFFNLIPSCKFCNFAKKDIWNTKKDNLLINPYDRKTTFDINFQATILNSKFYHDKKALELNFLPSIEKRIQNHIQAFHLDKLYGNHVDYVLELIHKKYMYSDSYIDELFRQYEGTIFKTREDVLKMIVSNYIDENDLLKRPLSKLTQDIVNQLDI